MSKLLFRRKLIHFLILHSTLLFVTNSINCSVMVIQTEENDAKRQLGQIDHDILNLKPQILPFKYELSDTPGLTRKQFYRNGWTRRKNGNIRIQNICFRPLIRPATLDFPRIKNKIRSLWPNIITF